MKTQTTKSFFKKVSSTGTNPRAGTKRPDLNWSFEAVEAEDLSSLSPVQASAMINSVIEAFGRKQIAQAGDDWNFVPSGINFTSAYEDLVAERTSSRLITKESLKALGIFYQVQVVKVLGSTHAAGLAGANLIQDRFRSVSGKNDVLGVMLSRFESLIEKCEEEEILPFVEVMEALMKEIGELMEITVSADML